MERAGGSGDASAKFARSDRQPLFSAFAVQHDAVEIAFDGGEENVVQGGNAHSRVGQGAQNENCTVLDWFEQCEGDDSNGSATLVFEKVFLACLLPFLAATAVRA